MSPERNRVWFQSIEKSSDMERRINPEAEAAFPHQMGPFSRAGRPVPPELRQQHQELLRGIQGLRARLQGGDPHFRTGEPPNPPLFWLFRVCPGELSRVLVLAEYAEHLERHLRLYTEAARRLGTQGERVRPRP